MGPLVYGGRYVVQNPLANAGGMGEVTLCSDPHLDRTVAIKFLKPGTSSRRMMDEIKALQQIRSKHVVQVYDLVRRADGAVGVVQEHLPGADLTHFSKGLTPERFLRGLYQLAAGLDDIHQIGLVHRDIKHNNVKEGSESLLKIFDFGLTRSEDAGDAHTTGFRGTHGFAAPELYVSGRVDFTRAVDVYAFGATALYMAKGSLPDVMRKQQPPNGEAWANGGGFGTLALNIPRSLHPLLNATLSTDAAARPDMRSIRDVIERRLVRGQHRGLLVHQGNNAVVNDQNRTATVAKPDGSVSLTIDYSGTTFRVSAVTGAAFINNTPASLKWSFQARVSLRSALATIEISSRSIFRARRSFCEASPQPR